MNTEILELTIPFETLELGLARARRLGRAVLVSHTERIAWLDVTALFAAAWGAGQVGFLWTQPDNSFGMVGLGVAHEIATEGAERFKATTRRWEEVLAYASVSGLDTVTGSGPTLVGGFAFDPQRSATDLWAEFGDGVFVLPRLHIVVRESTALLTTNVMVHPEDEPLAVLERAAEWQSEILGLPSAWLRRRLEQGLTSHDLLPPEQWQAIVAVATQELQRGAMEKVVLARAVEVTAPAPFDGLQVLRNLQSAYPFATTFAMTRGQSCFLGATPERLVGVQSGVVRATGLAGTTARGSTPEDDERLGSELLTSDKNRHEHAIVVDMLKTALQDLCSTVNAPATPTLLKLANVQHLYTPVSGRLRTGASLLDLVARLHPTPAVGGVPNNAALAYIREHEQLDRGWYAAPLGWLDARKEGDFVVALRSGLVEGNRATLFAGVGLVADSDPIAEYQETILKLRPMLGALRG